MNPTDGQVESGNFLGEGSRPIRLAGSILGYRAHICAFFRSTEDAYRVLLPFIKDSLECDEKAVHTVDPRRRDEHLQWLASAGIDVTAVNRNDQFELRDWPDTHLCGGQFNQHRTLALFEKVVRNAKHKGCPLVRFVRQMEWALETDMDPFFVPPDEFLEQLRERGATRTNTRAALDKNETEMEEPVGEVKHLKECVNNLISVLALPDVWTGGEAHQIVTALLDTLLGMLRLDCVYVGLEDTSSSVPIQMNRFIQSENSADQMKIINDARQASTICDTETWPLVIRKPFGQGALTIAIFRLGLNEKTGVLVAGSTH